MDMLNNQMVFTFERISDPFVAKPSPMMAFPWILDQEMNQWQEASRFRASFGTWPWEKTWPWCFWWRKGITCASHGVWIIRSFESIMMSFSASAYPQNAAGLMQCCFRIGWNHPVRRAVTENEYGMPHHTIYSLLNLKFCSWICVF